MTEPTRKPNFAAAIESFVETLELLRDFVEFVSPVLASRQNAAFKTRAKNLLPLAIIMSEVDAKGFEIGPAAREKLWEKAGDRVEIIGKHEDESGRKSVEFRVRGDLGEAFHRALKHVGRTHHSESLLYRSALINLTSSAEWCVSALLHEYFVAKPGAVGSADKLLSLEQLLAFATIEEAKQHYIELRVDEVLRGGLEKWLDFLRDKVKLGLSSIEPDLAQITEIFQRRHLLVHNAGRVNRHYLAAVGDLVEKGMKTGDSVIVDKYYINNAIGRVERCFLLIGAEFWRKIEPRDSNWADFFNDLAYQALTRERWSLAEGIARVVALDKKSPERSRLVAKINHWQAIKWQDRFSEIRAEVENEDFSAKEEVFSIARAALLDEHGACLSGLSKVIRRGDLSSADFREWPLFREVRKLPEAKDLLKQRAPRQKAKVRGGRSARRRDA